MALSLLMAITACGHGGSAAAARPAASPANLTATISDTDGRFLDGVAVTVASTGTSTSTDAGGRASVAVPTGTPQLLRLVKAGFADQFAVADLAAGTTASTLSAAMLPRPAAIALANVEAGGTATGVDGAAVTLPANALVDARGQAVRGTVQVSMAPLDVRTDLRAFPGLFEGIDAGGQRGPIVTWGSTEFVFQQNGNKLNLAPGATASIALPIYVPTEQDGSPVAAGQQLPLWSLDESTGIWRQEGTGTVVAAAASPTGFALAGTVSHFSWWNVDQARSLGNGSEPFRAHLVCVLAAEDNQPQRNLPAGTTATVRITVGDPAAPRGSATDQVPPEGSDELIPADVPVLLEADASFHTAAGALVIAHGTLAQIFPADGSGTVEIVLHGIEVPVPIIVTPAATVATNSSAPLYVEIALDGHQPDSLELTVDGQPLQTFTPQFFYRFFWDTSTATEGAHVLVATAVVQGARRPSAPRTVVVDRTPPQMVQLTPQPGHEVSGTQAFDVQFSEPVAAFPFRLDDAVVLTSTKAGPPNVLAAAISIDASGITVHVQPSAPLSFGTIGLSWGGLRDAAGNAVAGTVAATWPFDRTPALPGLSHVQNGSQLPIAVSSTGVLFVAHVPRANELIVSRYDDSTGTFVELPGPLNVTTVVNGQVPALAVDRTGAPVIAFSQHASGVSEYVVARFDGLAWQPLGTPISGRFNDGVVALQLDTQDHPVIAMTRNGSAEARRFDSSAGDFVLLGQPLAEGPGADVVTVDLGLKPDGNPVMAWVQNNANLFAREFDGTSWQPLGGNLDGVTGGGQFMRPPAVVVDGAAIYLAWSKLDGTDHVKVRRWNGSAWDDLGFPAQPPPDSIGAKLGLALRNGQLLLAYHSGSDPFVTAFDGTTWSAAIDAVGQTTNGHCEPLLATGGGRVFVSHIGCCSSLGHVVEVLFP